MPSNCIRVFLRWPAMAAVLLVLGSAATPAADPTTDAQYESALSEARAGRLDSALARLAQLLRRSPESTRILHDYVSLLQRAGRNEDALALLPRVDRARAPAYVLESLGAAAAGSGREALADELYLGVLQRYPGRAESMQGLADALAGRCRDGVPPAALDRMAGLRAGVRADLLHRAATTLEARANFYPALHLNLESLRADSTLAGARALRIRLAARLGAAHLALQLAKAAPGAVDATQLDTLERHVAAVDGRWANLLRGLPRHQRHGSALLEAAIARSDERAKRFLAGASLAEPDLKWLHDRMVLLGTQGRAADVDTLYRAFVQRALPLPTYALAAAADAQLRLRRPRAAIALYEQVLSAQPKDADARVGMYYALLEAEELSRARAWAAAWVADTAPPAGVPPSPVVREQHWAARVLQARDREFAGEPAAAEAALKVLAEQAPANAAVRAAQASTYRARGWPRRAWDTWHLQLLHDPEDTGAYAESVGPLLDTGRFAQAHTNLGEARKREPAALSVARAERAWHLHQRPELLLSANSGRSRDANAPGGDRDHRMDATLYTPPFGERYRAFAHAAWLYGDLPAGATRYRRAGAGLEYRGPDVRLAGEWHTGWRGDGGAGLRLGAKWWADDVWSVALDGDTKTVEIPLQARRAGVEAKRAALEVEARMHESRAFSGRFAVLDFTDGNHRQSALLVWREGWLTRPRYGLSSRLELYGSHNNREDAPYFNPRSDFSANLSVTGNWRTFRWYERAFTQELTLGAGRYWQKGFADGALWNIEYAHRWDLDDRFYLRYGIGRTLHPYDGQLSGRSYLTLDLDWRF